MKLKNISIRKNIFKLYLSFMIFLMAPCLHAQQNNPQGQNNFSPYYGQRVSHFQSLPKAEGSIVFMGNSITDGVEWSELFNDLNIKNRGISGDITAGILNRIEEIIAMRPEKVFLMIGVNDLAMGLTTDVIIANIKRTVEILHDSIPAAKLYVQSILPVNNEFGKFESHVNKATEIVRINSALNELSHKLDFKFIDLHSEFIDNSGKLDSRYTNDGLHLTGEGYLLWKHLIFPFVYDREEHASLIPLPQQVKYTKDIFFINQSAGIFSDNAELIKETLWLQDQFKLLGVKQEIISKPTSHRPYIHLVLGPVNSPQQKEEAYNIRVTSKKITVTANTSKGIYYGLQTLIQLFRDGVAAEGCNITDWPAFGWRGYMIDVGRNYMSMDLLKQKIDYLSRYKYNIFHFHLTEDVAWRIAIDRYPQLTAPENMLRNKGMYYTEAEMRELIEYCRERYITLVPEIDMPGHSAAFTRALGYHMQSDSGLIAVKNILRELVAKYDLPYWHIGADEVKITNKNFLPEVSLLMDSLKRRIIGWEPGGNFTNNTIRQLWMEDNGKIARQPGIQYIDSRHLYLNHMDPLEAVTTLFYRQICDLNKGNENALGGTLCTWNDRAAASEQDIMRMNPVYPGIIAFAERIWQGGGQQGWKAVIDPEDSLHTAAFAGFENRLLDHKDQYFQGLAFPYVKQQNIHWKLFGPYQNKGDVSARFPPEQNGKNWDTTAYSQRAIGGTIILRHWWAPQVKGILKIPSDSTTWYATTKIWSDTEGYKPFWIGFNNLSRSMATDSPPNDSWDGKGSAVWVNGKLIAPPVWKRGGQKGHSEIPLIDEGYEYRQPATIYLQQGWNEVLIKAPVGTFRGKDWQNPVKWMFSFAPLD